MENRFEAMEKMLQENSDLIEKLEAALKRVEAIADASPECGGLPEMLCGICYGSGKKSGGRR